MRSETVPCVMASPYTVKKMGSNGCIGFKMAGRFHGDEMTPANLIKFGKGCVQIGEELQAEAKGETP